MHQGTIIATKEFSIQHIIQLELFVCSVSPGRLRWVWQVGRVSSEHRGWDEVVLQWNSQLVQSADNVNLSIELRAVGRVATITRRGLYTVVGT